MKSRNNQGRHTGGNNKRRKGERIDVSRFIKTADQSVSERTIITNKFSDFALCPEIKKNLAFKNFETPTPIQDQAIKHIIDGRDLIGLASTGTGKTAAFLLPLIDKVYKNHAEKVLIIAPTRELALQIEVEFRSFSYDMKIFSAACVGGMPIFKQIRNLKRNPNFVIGTPGRLKDLSDRGIIKYETFKNIVLDEVDRMLDMGFVDEIKEILNKLPAGRQSLFFSATMPPKIQQLIRDFSQNPITIEVSKGETAKNVDQNIVRVIDKESKFTQLKELLVANNQKVLIFSETKRDVERLAKNLANEGYKAESIHGDKRQSQRQRALSMFRNDDINILVATDVAARGLDIKDISLVINYTIPQTYDDYVHRIGRTGRGESMGKALTFVE